MESLFDLVPHRPEIETQHEAALAIAAKVPKRRVLIRDALRKAECGLTREELSTVLNLPIQSICGQVKPMMDRGEIDYQIDPDTGTWLKRPTHSGQKAYVCFLVD